MFQLAGYATWRTLDLPRSLSGNETASCSVSTEKIEGILQERICTKEKQHFRCKFNTVRRVCEIEFSIDVCRFRSVLANGSLYFTSVQHSRNERPDEGLYQCSATRPSVGTIISRAAKLQIASLPRFELEPKDVAVRVGDTARFNCLVMVINFSHFVRFSPLPFFFLAAPLSIQGPRLFALFICKNKQKLDSFLTCRQKKK